jgi:hypothetical protein
MAKKPVFDAVTGAGIRTGFTNGFYLCYQLSA